MCNKVCNLKQRETGSEGLVRALREGDDAAKMAAARTLCNRADLYFEYQVRIAEARRRWLMYGTS